MIEVILVMLVAVLLVVWGWLFVCVQKTYHQRLELLPKVGDPAFWIKHAAWRDVSYDEHMWALVFFRDPMKLYDEVLK